MTNTKCSYCNSATEVTRAGKPGRQAGR